MPTRQSKGPRSSTGRRRSLPKHKPRQVVKVQREINEYRLLRGELIDIYDAIRSLAETYGWDARIRHDGQLGGSFTIVQQRLESDDEYRARLRREREGR